MLLSGKKLPMESNSTCKGPETEACWRNRGRLACQEQRMGEGSGAARERVGSLATVQTLAK